MNLEEKLQLLFQNDNLENGIELMHRVLNTFPLDDKDNVEHFRMLMIYVDELINGDDIEQIVMSTARSKYAKESFEKVIDEKHQQILKDFKEKKTSLQKEVDDLTTKNDSLTTNVSFLTNEKIKLLEEITSLQKELSDIKKKLEEERKNGFNKVHEEISKEKEKLEREIKELTSTKEVLEKGVQEQKEMFHNQGSTLSSNETSGVVWKAIEANHPIYSLNRDMIDDYIKALQTEYKKNMNVTEEECKVEFRKNCPGLFVIKNILENMWFGKLSDYTTIAALVQIANSSINCDAKEDCKNIQSALNGLKLPEYKLVNENVDSKFVSDDTVPTNMKVMIRELYFKRIALEAVAKQKVLEDELKIVLEILKSVAPVDLDISSLLPNYDTLNLELMKEK